MTTVGKGQSKRSPNNTKATLGDDEGQGEITIGQVEVVAGLQALCAACKVELVTQIPQVAVLIAVVVLGHVLVNDGILEGLTSLAVNAVSQERRRCGIASIRTSSCKASR